MSDSGLYSESVPPEPSSKPTPSEWGRQFDAERSWLRHQARKLLGRRGPVDIDSEDLVQDVHLRGLRNRSRLRFASRGKLRAWLKVVAQNILRDYFRKKRPDQLDSTEAQHLMASDTSPTKAAARGEDRGDLKRAVERLPAQQAEIVKLRVWSELSFSDIAKRYAVTDACARVQFHRAMKTLKARMSGEMDRDL